MTPNKKQIIRPRHRMTITGADLVQMYPHKDKEMFMLHCAYNKHSIVLFEQGQVIKSVSYGLCSCGAVFAQIGGSGGKLFPIWQAGLSSNNAKTLLGAAHIKWSQTYWGLSYSPDFDLAVMQGLGLDDTM